jgi:hypothetical protein
MKPEAQINQSTHQFLVQLHCCILNGKLSMHLLYEDDKVTVAVESLTTSVPHRPDVLLVLSLSLPRLQRTGGHEISTYEKNDVSRLQRDHVYSGAGLGVKAATAQRIEHAHSRPVHTS